MDNVYLLEKNDTRRPFTEEILLEILSGSECDFDFDDSDADPTVNPETLFNKLDQASESEADSEIENSSCDTSKPKSSDRPIDAKGRHVGPEVSSGIEGESRPKISS